MSWQTDIRIHGQIIHPTEKFISLMNSISLNMGMIFFTSDLMKAVRGQKHLSEAKKDMKELIYRISSYKALPRIIPATLIMPAAGKLLCRWNLVISNNTRIWRPNEKLIPAVLIWGNTVVKFDWNKKMVILEIYYYYMPNLLYFPYAMLKIHHASQPFIHIYMGRLETN